MRRSIITACCRLYTTTSPVENVAAMSAVNTKAAGGRPPSHPRQTAGRPPVRRRAPAAAACVRVPPLREAAPGSLLGAACHMLPPVSWERTAVQCLMRLELSRAEVQCQN